MTVIDIVGSCVFFVILFALYSAMYQAAVVFNYSLCIVTDIAIVFKHSIITAFIVIGNYLLTVIDQYILTINK